jgi:hypothetical protein
VPPGSVLPELFVARDKQDDRTPARFTHEALFITPLIRMFAPHLDKRLRQETLVELSAGLLGLPSLSKEALIKHSKITEVKSWQKLLEDIAHNDTKRLYRKLELFFNANKFIPAFNLAAAKIRNTLSDALYIGPARATSERYYRYQDLAVSEIDPDGKNFPMFLNSLSDAQVTNLSKWIQKLFGYGVKVTRAQTHNQ